MPNIQVKDVPKDVHTVLRRRAAEHGQSLQEYLLEHLTQFGRNPTMDEVLDRIAQRTGGSIGFDESARIIRELRGEP